MTFPRKMFVLARTRGRKTQFFYGLKLGKLITDHIRVGDSFQYATQITSDWRTGTRTTKTSYSTEGV